MTKSIFQGRTISDVTILQARLDELGLKYLLQDGLPAARVCIQFEGRLYDTRVVWNACIRTMEEYALENPVSSDPQQLISIEVEAGVHYLEVVLNVSEIDRAVIERTIIMIRKYKRLKEGRHEYGARSKTEQRYS
ncbi:MAG TPA: hypothetical protein ENJ08_14660 [Gammaproteobacteria bacterium]|nr:hypothetical protein [Gammaproteobacteria bacterium]